MILAIVAALAFAAGVAATLIADAIARRILRRDPRPAAPALDREAVTYYYAHTMGMRHSAEALRTLATKTRNEAERDTLARVADAFDRVNREAFLKIASNATDGELRAMADVEGVDLDAVTPKVRA